MCNGRGGRGGFISVLLLLKMEKIKRFLRNFLVSFFLCILKTLSQYSKPFLREFFEKVHQVRLQTNLNGNDCHALAILSPQ